MGLALHHQGHTFKQLHTIWPVCFAAYDKHMVALVCLSVCLFVCLSVDTITQKGMNGFE